MIAGILLAAGSSTRFGHDKRLHALGDGTPMALAALQPLLTVLDQVVVVVRPQDGALATRFAAAGARVTEAPGWRAGMGASLARGIGALEAGTTGCVVALADMPYVRANSIRRVVSGLEDGASLVAPTYRGSRGHPVGFAAEWFDTLGRLHGDHGARDLLAIHRERLHLVEVDDAGVLVDVDYPEDVFRGTLHG